MIDGFMEPEFASAVRVPAPLTGTRGISLPTASIAVNEAIAPGIAMKDRKELQCAPGSL
jgi:hypothetical protein